MELGDANLYSALEGYEKSIRERKFRIAEAEDRIASLKTSLGNVQKENAELKIKRDKLKMNTQVAEANYQTQLKKRAVLQETKSLLDAEHAVILKKVDRKKKTIEAMKAFQTSRVNHLQTTEKNFKDGYKSIRSVKQLTSMQEDADFMGREISAKSKEVQEIQSTVKIMQGESTNNWSRFVKICLGLAEANVELRKSMKTQEDLDVPVPKDSNDASGSTNSLDQTEIDKRTSEESAEGSYNRLMRRVNKPAKSSGFQDTLERLRNSRMKLTSLSNAGGASNKDRSQDGCAGTSEKRRRIGASRNTLLDESDCNINSMEKLTISIQQKPLEISNQSCDPVALVSEVVTVVSPSEPSNEITPPKDNHSRTSLFPAMEGGDSTTASNNSDEFQKKLQHTVIQTTAAAMEFDDGITLADSDHKNAPCTATSSPSVALQTHLNQPKELSSIGCSDEVKGAAKDNDSKANEVALSRGDIFKVPARPVTPSKPSSSVPKNGCVTVKSTTSTAAKLPSFLNFEEDFTNKETGFLDIFGNSEETTPPEKESSSGFDFNNVLFGNNSGDNGRQSFF